MVDVSEASVDTSSNSGVASMNLSLNSRKRVRRVPSIVVVSGRARSGSLSCLRVDLLIGVVVSPSSNGGLSAWTVSQYLSPFTGPAGMIFVGTLSSSFALAQICAFDRNPFFISVGGILRPTVLFLIIGLIPSFFVTSCAAPK